jgi:epsilon-lactone hydrolase
MGVRLALRPATAPWMPLGVKRRWMETLSRLGTLPRGIHASAETLGAVPALRYERDDSDPAQALLYFHGGGFVVASPRTHRGIASALVHACGAPVHLPDYRRAPEHPYPAALEDGLAAYRGLLDSGLSPERIAMGGDSAGGGISLATAMRLRDSGEPLPGALLLLCPWLDLTLSGRSRRLNAGRDPGLHDGSSQSDRDHYLGNRPVPVEHSIGEADLSGLPPILVQSGDGDLLSSDSHTLAERAREAGVEVTHTPFAGVWHDFQLEVGILREANDAVREAGAFLRRIWDGTPST